MEKVTISQGLTSGTRLGAYEILRELGRGGMATVYLARDLKHDRLVALKVLHPELAATLGPERFLREIRIVASLSHPHILPLHDSGEAGGMLYYVMPYVEGESLRQRLTRERQLSVADALKLTTQVASALGYAHGRGIIHRDIKPENILLEGENAVVADFGIGRALAVAGGERLTETGLAIGTPAYMSPEQAMGDRQLDGRSDLYSLGCVLYEMLAGEPPYTGATAQAIMAKRLRDPVPSARRLREELPAHVDAAIRKTLAKAPADRFRSATDFVDALKASGDVASTSRRNQRLAAAVALVLGIIGIGAALVFGPRARPAPASAPASHRQITFTGSADAPAFSPDGKSVAYVSDHRTLVVQGVEGGEPVTLVPHVRFISSPRWSPKGEWLYFIMVRDSSDIPATYRVPSRGGRAEKVVDDVVPFDLASGGQELVRRFADTLRFEDVASGAVVSQIPIRRAIRDSIPENAWWIWGPIALSPEGKWIAFGWADPNFAGVAAVSADGRSFARIAPGGTPPVRWAPGGDALYSFVPGAGGADLTRTDFDPRSGQALSEPVVVVSGLQWNPTALVDFDVSPDGRTLVYVRGPQSQHIWTIDLSRHGRGDAPTVRQITQGTRLFDWAALSPDGRTLAFLRLDGVDSLANWNFYWVPFEGGPATPLTSRGAMGNPSWSPDGTRFVYIESDSTGPALMMTDRAGQLRERIGTLPPAYVPFYRPSWSADGRTLVYPADRGRAQVVLDLPTRMQRVVPFPDSLGHIIAIVMSPDASELIAAVEPHTRRLGLWRTSVDTPAWSAVPAPFGDNVPLIWGTDGWIYLFNDWVSPIYGRRPDELPTIWRMRPDGSKRELYARLSIACLRGFVTMSADGRRLACAVSERQYDVWLASQFDPKAP